MAVEGYMYFQGYAAGGGPGDYLASESTVRLTKGAPGEAADIITPFSKAQDGPIEDGCKSALFEIEDYSFDIEQTLGIGSQSTGVGTGRCQFNPFSITRKIDRASPHFFRMACAGKSFCRVGLGLRKAAGTDSAGVMYLAFTFSLVGVKTVSWAHDDEAPKETVTFEYGAVAVQYAMQQPGGKLDKVIAGGWNRVRNIRADDPSNSKDFLIQQ
jgi:type VI secretion system secreted protein Hcp